jgi:hypothetical protein
LGKQIMVRDGKAEMNSVQRESVQA